MSNQFKARGMRVLGRVLDMFKSAVKAEDLTPPPLPPDGNARLKFREMFKPVVEGDVDEEVGFENEEIYKAHGEQIEAAVRRTMDFVRGNTKALNAKFLGVANGYQGHATSLHLIRGGNLELTVVGFLTIMFSAATINHARRAGHGIVDEDAAFDVELAIGNYGQLDIQIWMRADCDDRFKRCQSVTIAPLQDCYDEATGCAVRAHNGVH